MDRAITLNLRRKTKGEKVDRIRYAESGLFDDLAARLCRFADDNREAVRRARPELPHSLNDRAQDNWEPLLAIADVAGGGWPKFARDAALHISGGADEAASIGNELLADIKEVFETKDVDKISMADLVKTLIEEDEWPWATYSYGKPMTTRQLSRRLKEYGIVSKSVRCDPFENPAKGYQLKQFEDAFARYLPATPLSPVTQSQPSNHAGFAVTDAQSRDRSENALVTPKPLQHKECDRVTEKKGSTGTYDDIEGEI